MPLMIGADKIKSIYVGDNKIANVSVGSQLVHSSKTSRLPYGYTEVEYIQSDGTQYIAVKDAKPSTNTKIVMDVEPTENATSTKKYFFDSSRLDSSGTGGTHYALRMAWSTDGVSGAMGSYSPSIQTTIITSDTKMRRMIVQMDVNENTASVDGISKSFSNNNIVSTMTNIKLLTYSASSGLLSAKLYSCQIYNTGSTPIKDLVPCKNPDGVAGMLDIANEVFYASSGSGAFVAGPAI